MRIRWNGSGGCKRSLAFSSARRNGHFEKLLATARFAVFVHGREKSLPGSDLLRSKAAKDCLPRSEVYLPQAMSVGPTRNWSVKPDNAENFRVCKRSLRSRVLVPQENLFRTVLNLADRLHCAGQHVIAVGSWLALGRRCETGKRWAGKQLFAGAKCGPWFLMLEIREHQHCLAL